GCFIFFFSSRRRHTRCLSDWSSDVCSSDLDGIVGATQRLARRLSHLLHRPRTTTTTPPAMGSPHIQSLGMNSLDVVAPMSGHPKIGRASCRERGEITEDDGTGVNRQHTQDS